MTYRDMCFCSRSKADWMNTKDKLCSNTKCMRHASNIPFDKIPEWELFSISDFGSICESYKRDNSQLKE